MDREKEEMPKLKKITLEQITKRADELGEDYQISTRDAEVGAAVEIFIHKINEIIEHITRKERNE